MGSYGDTCDEACGQFKLVVKKDGTYSVSGMTLEKFLSIFPKFSVSVSGEGEISVNNFYVGAATVNKDNPTQLSISGSLVAPNTMTTEPSITSQITSWGVKNGTSIVGTTVPVGADIAGEDYPTLLEVLQSVDNTEYITSLVCPLYGEYKDQVSEALASGLLPSLTYITISLDSGVPDGALLSQCASVAASKNLRGRVLIPDLEQPSHSPIFEITSTETKINLYPYYFNGDAEDDICSYVNALIAASIAYSPTKKIQLYVYDYHYPTDFAAGVLSDTEPLENLLTTLLKLQNCGMSFGETPFKFITPYGWVESSDKAWNYYTSFHHSTTGGVACLEGTYRPEYEAAVIATVANIVGGMSWAGGDYADLICHDVMATAWALTPDNLNISGLSVTGANITPFTEITFPALFGEYEFRLAREAFLQFWGGFRDSVLSLEQEDGTFIDTKVVVVDGISETAGAKYAISVMGDREGFDHINTCDDTPETLGALFKEGSTITLTSTNGANCFNNVGLPLYFLNEGATEVTYTNENDCLITVTADSMTTGGLSYSGELPIFGTHQTPRSTLSGGVLTITSFAEDDLSMYLATVIQQGVTDIYLTALPSTSAKYIIENIGAGVSFFVTSSQVISDKKEYAILKYGIGKNIICTNADFASLIDKKVGDYYSYMISDGDIFASPITYSFIYPSIIFNLGESYRTILEYIRDSIDGVIGSTVERLSSSANLPTFPITGGEMWIVGNFTETSEGAIGHDGHSDYLKRYTLESESIEIIAQSHPNIVSVCEQREEKFPLAKITVGSDMTVSIEQLSSYKIGDFVVVQVCDVDETCTENSQGVSPQEEVDMNEAVVEYTITHLDGGAIRVAYNAFDKLRNDITDQFNTLTIGDKFLHRGMM